MHIDAVLGSFVVTFSRVAGTVSWIPIPGMRSALDPSRILLAVSLTLVLSPAWPGAPAGGWTAGTILAAVTADALYGIASGLVVAFLLEGFLVAAQAVGLQAGLSFASTIDPTSQADSPALLVLMQWTAGLLFLAAGLHHEVIRAIALSLRTAPPGAVISWLREPEFVWALGSSMLTLGVRLSLPVVALLLFADLALALMSRIQPQLQLLSLAFPVKTLAALLLLAASASVAPALFERAAGPSVAALYRLAHGN